jgi:hypothetical protein
MQPLTTFKKFFLNSWVGKKVTEGAKLIGGGLLKVASAPSWLIGKVGDKARGSLIKSGNADFMSAEQRLAFADKHGIKDYSFSGLDQSLANTDAKGAESLAEQLKLMRNNGEGLEDSLATSRANMRKDVQSNGSIDNFTYRKIEKLMEAGKYKEAIDYVQSMKNITSTEKMRIINALKSGQKEVAKKRNAAEAGRTNIQAGYEKLSKQYGLDITGDNAKKIEALARKEAEAKRKDEGNGNTVEGEAADGSGSLVTAMNTNTIETVNILTEINKNLQAFLNGTKPGNAGAASENRAAANADKTFDHGNDKINQRAASLNGALEDKMFALNQKNGSMVRANISDENIYKLADSRSRDGKKKDRMSKLNKIIDRGINLTDTINMILGLDDPEFKIITDFFDTGMNMNATELAEFIGVCHDDRIIGCVKDFIKEGIPFEHLAWMKNCDNEMRRMIIQLHKEALPNATADQLYAVSGKYGTIISNARNGMNEDEITRSIGKKRGADLKRDTKAFGNQEASDVSKRNKMNVASDAMNKAGKATNGAIDSIGNATMAPINQARGFLHTSAATQDARNSRAASERAANIDKGNNASLKEEQKMIEQANKGRAEIEKNSKEAVPVGAHAFGLANLISGGMSVLSKGEQILSPVTKVLKKGYNGYQKAKSIANKFAHPIDTAMGYGKKKWNKAYNEAKAMQAAKNGGASAGSAGGASTETVSTEFGPQTYTKTTDGSMSLANTKENKDIQDKMAHKEEMQEEIVAKLEEIADNTGNPQGGGEPQGKKSGGFLSTLLALLGGLLSMLNPLSLAKKLFSILRSVGGKLFGTILKDILPAILKRFPMLGKLLGGLFSGGGAGGLFSGIKGLGGKALGWLSDKAMIAKDVAGGTLKAMGGLALDAGGKALSWGKDKLGGILGGAGRGLSKLGGKIGGIFGGGSSSGGGFLGKLKGKAGSLLGAAKGIGGKALGMAPGLAKGAAGLMVGGGMIDGIKSLTCTALDWVKSQIFGGDGGDDGSDGNDGSNGGGGLLDTAMDYGGKAVDWAKEKAGNLWNKAKDYGSRAAGWVGEKASGLWNGAKSVAGKAAGWVGDKASAIKNAGSKAVDWGLSHIEGAKGAALKGWQGIKGVASSAMDAGSSFMSKAADAGSGVIEAVKNRVSGLLKTIGNYAAKMIPKNIAGKLSTVLDKIMEKVTNPQNAAKLAEKIGIKQGFTAAEAGAGPETLGVGTLVVGAAEIGFWFTKGYNNASEDFDLKDGVEPTTGMKFASGLAEAVTGATPIGYVLDGKDVIDIVQDIMGSDIGASNKDVNSANQSNDGAQQQMSGGNDSNGGDDGDDDNKSWFDKAKDFAANAASSAKNAVVGAYDWAKDKVSGIASVIKNRFGSGKWGRGAGDFYSQLDPSVAGMRFNAPGDTVTQTIGDSACGPASMLNMASALGKGKWGRSKWGRGASDLVAAAKDALPFKEKDGGVHPDYFRKEGEKLGIHTENIGVSNMDAAVDAGKPVILMGRDSNNNGTGNTPGVYGPYNHYITVTGKDKKGNYITQDPEGNPNQSVSKNYLKAHSSLAIAGSTGRGKWGRAKAMIASAARRAKLGFGRSKWGRGTDNAETIWNLLTTQYGLSNQAAAGIMGNMQQESGFDPHAVQGGGSADEPPDSCLNAADGSNAYGLCQWTGSRLRAMNDFAKSQGKSAGDIEVQLAFMKQEAGDTWNTISNAGTAEEAATIWAREFERCGIDGSRVAYATDIFAKQGKGITNKSTPSKNGNQNGNSSGGNQKDYSGLYGKIAKIQDALSSAFDFGEKKPDNKNGNKPGGLNVTGDVKYAVLKDLSKFINGGDPKIAAGAQVAMKTSQLTGLPADLIFAQMVNESGWFKSAVAEADHNYGGIKAYGDAKRGSAADDGEYYRHFDSDEEYAQYYATTLKKYEEDGIGQADTPEKFAHALKAGGYYAGDETDYANTMRGILNGGGGKWGRGRRSLPIGTTAKYGRGFFSSIADFINNRKPAAADDSEQGSEYTDTQPNPNGDSGGDDSSSSSDDSSKDKDGKDKDGKDKDGKDKDKNKKPDSKSEDIGDGGLLDKIGTAAEKMSKGLHDSIAPVVKGIGGLATKIFGSNITKIFGKSNPFENLFNSGGKKSGKDGSSSSNSTSPNGKFNSTATDEGIKKASQYAQSRVGTQGYGNNGCTTWCQVYLKEAGNPFADQMDLNCDNLQAQAKSGGIWKEATQAGAEGDIALVETDHWNTPGPDHAVIYDGNGGCWGNSSSRDQIMHYDNMLDAFPEGLHGYVATGSGNGSVAASGGNARSSSESAGDASLDYGGGKWGRAKNVAVTPNDLNKLMSQTNMIDKPFRKRVINGVKDVAKENHLIKNNKDNLSGKDDAPSSNAGKGKWGRGIGSWLKRVGGSVRDFAVHSVKSIGGFLSGDAKADTTKTDVPTEKEVAPNGKNYETNDVKYLTDKGYSREDAIKFLATDPKYAGKAGDDTAPNGTKYSENDIKYLLSKGYTRADALKFLATDPKYAKAAGKGKWGRGGIGSWFHRITTSVGDFVSHGVKSIGGFLSGDAKADTTKTDVPTEKEVAPNGKNYETNDVKYLTDKGYSREDALKFLATDPKYAGKAGDDTAPNGTKYSENDIKYLLSKGYTRADALKFLATDPKYAKASGKGKWGRGGIGSWFHRITTSVGDFVSHGVKSIGGFLSGDANADTTKASNVPTEKEVAPNGKNYETNDVKYLLDKGYSREDALKFLATDPKYAKSDDTAPNGTKYSENDIKYLLSKGYTRADALKFLATDPKYAKASGKGKWGRGGIGSWFHRITTSIGDFFSGKSSSTPAANVPTEKEVAPNGKNYETNDVKYLLDKGYKREDALKLLSTDPKYAKSDDTAPNGKKYSENDIKYLLSKGYTRTDALNFLATDPKYAKTNASSTPAPASIAPAKSATEQASSVLSTKGTVTLPTAPKAAAPITAPAPNPNSIEGIRATIADIPIDQIAEYNRILDTDSIAVAKAKAEKARSEYQKATGTGKWGRGNGIDAIRASISDIPESSIPSYNRINDDDDLFVARAKARRIRAMYGGSNSSTMAAPTSLASVAASAPSVGISSTPAMSSGASGNIDAAKTIAEIRACISDIPESSIPSYNRISDDDDLFVARAKAKRIRAMYGSGSGKWGRGGIGSWFHRITTSIGDFFTGGSSSKSTSAAVAVEKEVAPNGKHYETNDVNYLTKNGFTRDAAIKYLANDPKYSSKDLAPNGQEYSENDIKYLLSKGYTRADAIKFLATDPKYAKKKEEEKKAATAPATTTPITNTTLSTTNTSVPTPPKTAAPITAAAPNPNSIEGIRASIADIPQDQIADYNKILDTDSLDVARAKAEKARSEYQKATGTGKWGRGNGLDALRQSISDIPQDQIADYNKILDTDSLDVAHAKATQIRANYRRSLPSAPGSVSQSNNIPPAPGTVTANGMAPGMPDHGDKFDTMIELLKGMAKTLIVIAQNGNGGGSAQQKQIDDMKTQLGSVVSGFNQTTGVSDVFGGKDTSSIINSLNVLATR